MDYYQHICEIRQNAIAVVYFGLLSVSTTIYPVLQILLFNNPNEFSLPTFYNCDTIVYLSTFLLASNLNDDLLQPFEVFFFLKDQQPF